MPDTSGGDHAVVSAAGPDIVGPALVDDDTVTFNSDGSISRDGLLNLLVTHSDTGMAVFNAKMQVVLFNRKAVEYGLLSDPLPDEVVAAVGQVFANGDDNDFDFVPPYSNLGFVSTGRTVPRTVENVRCTVRLAEHGTSRYAIVYGDDDSTNLRVEATRRDFAANVSHELKTPLGAIGLMAEAMLESRDDPDSVEHFGRRVLKEATRMGVLINEIIGLSRLQEGRVEHFDILDVDVLVDDALSGTAVAADLAEIALVSDGPSGMRIRGDRALVQSALNNLLANAVNYSPTGEVVSVSRRFTEIDGVPMAAIAVTDRGIGIAPADQQRVFERFFRVDKARSRATGGTGLGLAIVKHIVASHNGQVGLWSRPGTGSTFTLYLPIAPSNQAEDQPS